MPENKRNNEIDFANFCYYPFMQLLLQPTGEISPCCWNQKLVLGKITQESLGEIWNGENSRALRREFLAGKPVSCAQQIAQIGCHRWSSRDFKGSVSLSEVQAHAPQRLDVRLNGQCNLECRMCEVWKQPNGVYDSSEFWTRGPSEIFRFLREIDVLGGEPFVQQDTYRLIDEVFALNPECTWGFVTNGHYRFGEPIRKRLDKIHLRWIQVSLDSLKPATYARIRTKGELQRTLRTFEELRQYGLLREEQGRPFRLMVSMCVQRENWQEVGEFLDFADRNGADPMLQFAFDPESESLLALSEKERQIIFASLEKLNPTHGPDRLRTITLPLRDSLNGNTPLQVQG